MKENNNLIYKLDNIEGVEIDTLCKSLKAIGEEFQRFTSNQKTLVVKEVRKGSGVFEFVEMIVVPILAGMDVSNTVLQFAEYISIAKDVILKKKDKLPNGIPMTKATVDNVNSMLSPVIIGNNNTINLYVGTEENPPIMSVDATEYKEIKARSRNTLKELQSSNISIPNDQTHSKVLFQWVQTRFDSKTVGNRGVIKQIYEKPVKVIFADDNSDAKREMTTSTMGIDWQEVKYFVDVEVVVNDNRIVAYKILKNYPDDSIVGPLDDPELF